MTRKLLASLSLLAVTTVSALANDIVDTAAKAGSFNTLLAAAKAAGLVDVLKSKGPFTVFAPTDEAFAKLGSTVEDLLKPENRGTLKAILTYHVLPAKVDAMKVMKLKNGSMVKTVQGEKIKVSTRNGVMVNNAKVLKTDVMASNGVIHVIDSVILPPSVAKAMAGKGEHAQSTCNGGK